MRKRWSNVDTYKYRRPHKSLQDKVDTSSDEILTPWVSAKFLWPAALPREASPKLKMLSQIHSSLINHSPGFYSETDEFACSSYILTSTTTPTTAYPSPTPTFIIHCLLWDFSVRPGAVFPLWGRLYVVGFRLMQKDRRVTAQHCNRSCSVQTYWRKIQSDFISLSALIVSFLHWT